MEDTFAIVAIFIGLPWLILHYITRWKTAPTLTNDDEALLEELYQLSRRLDDRLETVERLVSADHPDFAPRSLPARDDLTESKLADFDRALTRRTAK
ncbi:MAG: envelope stress response membrane protein PspB [Sphingomonadales bacterium]|nr:envelope stress response membrane protein PspB [Sphingomonadales bacterium]